MASASAASGSGSGGSSTGKNPFAWLGLLKWSLSYADGTRDETPGPMSAEDKAFLEKVMAEGIINEGDRMQEILKSVTAVMEEWKTAQTSWTNAQADETNEWLQELRDIVEQIDYARAFSSMQGSAFLLGCIQERDYVPPSTRSMCLGVLATMAGNNPPIQKELLELGALKTLSDVYFQETADASTAAQSSSSGNTDANGTLRARIMQALSAAIRSHDLAEQVFCQTEQAVSLLESGLGVDHDGDTSVVLRQRSLFFLRALLTSESATRERVVQFSRSLAFVFDVLTTAEQPDDQLRELSLALLQHILEQKRSVNVVLQRKNALVGRGIQRVAALRVLTGDDKDYATAELEHWEAILVLLVRAVPDDLPGTSDDGGAAPPLMLGPSDAPTLPQ